MCTSVFLSQQHLKLTSEKAFRSIQNLKTTITCLTIAAYLITIFCLQHSYGTTQDLELRTERFPPHNFFISIWNIALEIIACCKLLLSNTWGRYRKGHRFQLGWLFLNTSLLQRQQRYQRSLIAI